MLALSRLRSSVNAPNAQISQLVTLTNEAVSKASLNRERPVPGSIESRQSRANRLKADLDKARLELAAAQALLGDLTSGGRLSAP